MPDTFPTPRVWTAGERVSAAKMNEISTALSVLFPYAAGGDIAYRDPAGAYLTALSKPAGLGLLQNSSAGIPSYLTGGSALQALMKNAANNGYEWAGLAYRRQGGNSTIWSSPGTTSYTPAKTIIQTGTANVSISSGVGNTAITYPQAYTQRPTIFLSFNGTSLLSWVWSFGWTDDTTTGFSLHVKFAGAYNGTVIASWLALGG